ncbi:C42S1 protein, partial [Psilopogon haemacephalus]|nr:C42S1 protein [Psilopogon haemacephalus]
MSDFWHKLGCCVVEKPQPVRGGAGRGWVELGGAGRSLVGLGVAGQSWAGLGRAGVPSPQSGAVQEMRSKGGRERQWSSSRGL